MKTEPTESPTGSKSYVLRIEKGALDKIDKHIAIKNLSPNQQTSIHQWVSAAIDEKLSTPPEVDTHPEEPDVRTMRIFLSEKAERELHDRVKLIKDTYGKGSIRDFILKAISEKMERETAENRKVLESVLETLS